MVIKKEIIACIRSGVDSAKFEQYQERGRKDCGQNQNKHRPVTVFRDANAVLP